MLGFSGQSDFSKIIFEDSFPVKNDDTWEQIFEVPKFKEMFFN